MEDKLNEFVTKFTEREPSDYNTIAADVVKDINYLTEHAKRTKRNTMLDFEIIPTRKYSIKDYFIKYIMVTDSSYWLKRIGIETLLKIIDVTDEITSMDYLGWGEDDEKIRELIEWSTVFEHYTGESLFKWLDSFIGGSTRTEEIRKRWEELELSDI